MADPVFPKSLEDIVKAYRARKNKDDSIREMLGIKSSAFYERLKKK